MIKKESLKILAREYRKVRPRRNFVFDEPLLLDHPATIEGGYWENCYVIDRGKKYLYTAAQWEDEKGNKIELYEQFESIKFYPTKNFDLIIAIYNDHSELFPWPNNIVVYESNGEIRKIVESPVLDLEYYIQKKGERARKIRGQGSAFYISWEYYGHPEVLADPNTVVVGFTDPTVHQQVMENKLFDPYQGLFVKTLSSEKPQGRFL